MIRLHFIVEGQTEEAFVNSVLRGHLGDYNIAAVTRCVETSRKRRKIHRGGMIDYQRAKRDITRWMKEDQNPDARFTTMFDLYALPTDFPEFDSAKKCTNPYERVETLEQAMAQDIDSSRFIPYIQLHEFEALIFSDPSTLSTHFHNHNNPIDRLIKMSTDFKSPELIDDGKESAPSKRLIHEIPEYDGRKVSVGPLVTSKIGLDTLREECPHFHSWIEKIELLAH